MNKYRVGWIISLILSIISLIIGALSHYLRLNTADSFLYNLGIFIGIIMICCFFIFLIIFLILLFWDHHNQDINLNEKTPIHLSDEAIKFLQVIVLNEIKKKAPIKKKDIKIIIKYCKEHYSKNLLDKNEKPNLAHSSIYSLSQEVIKNLNKENIDYLNAKLISL